MENTDRICRSTKINKIAKTDRTKNRIARCKKGPAKQSPFSHVHNPREFDHQYQQLLSFITYLLYSLLISI